MGPVLVLTGATAAAIGAWRSYGALRAALGPLVHGDRTRTAVESARSPYDRPRVRVVARRLAASVGWLLVAAYGVFLASVGSVAM